VLEGNILFLVKTDFSFLAIERVIISLKKRTFGRGMHSFYQKMKMCIKSGVA